MTVRTVLAADAGPVAHAGIALVYQSALADVVTITIPRDGIYAFELTRPYGLLSTGERGLWDLLASMVHGDLVGLYDVASRLDDGNKSAVAEALGIYFGAVTA